MSPIVWLREHGRLPGPVVKSGVGAFLFAAAVLQAVGLEAGPGRRLLAMSACGGLGSVAAGLYDSKRRSFHLSSPVPVVAMALVLLLAATHDVAPAAAPASSTSGSDRDVLPDGPTTTVAAPTLTSTVATSVQEGEVDPCDVDRPGVCRFTLGETSGSRTQIEIFGGRLRVVLHRVQFGDPDGRGLRDFVYASVLDPDTTELPILELNQAENGFVESFGANCEYRLQVTHISTFDAEFTVDYHSASSVGCRPSSSGLVARYVNLTDGVEVFQIVEPLCVSGSGPVDGRYWWPVASKVGGVDMFPGPQPFGKPENGVLRAPWIHIGSSAETGLFELRVYDVSEGEVATLQASNASTNDGRNIAWHPPADAVLVAKISVQRKKGGLDEKIAGCLP